MRIIYFDIDSLRPDHLGCYGYARETSPVMDGIAQRGILFRNCYTPDAPCLPSRSSLSTGLFGIHHGAVAHRGARTRPFCEGDRREFRSTMHHAGFFHNLQRAKYKTCSISSYPHNHSAWHFMAGFDELHHSGSFLDRVEDIEPIATDWLQRNGAVDNWFLHVNLWDVHLPYRTPMEYGHPFAEAPLPAAEWLTEEVWREHWKSGGMRSARHMMRVPWDVPRYPQEISSLAEVRRLYDGYDTAIRYVDDCIGRLLGILETQGVLEETAIMISADHGESLGEMGAYATHQLANEQTMHVPMILHWPGLEGGGREVNSLVYTLDLAATVLELAGIEPEAPGDGKSVAAELAAGREPVGRPYLALSHIAQGVQRSVRFDWEDVPYLCSHTYHDAFHRLAEWLLFDLRADRYCQRNLAETLPHVRAHGQQLLEKWVREQLEGSPYGDPLEEVLADGPEVHWQREAHFTKLEAAGQGELVEYFRSRPRNVETGVTS